MQPGHAWLARHYKWGLDRVFLQRKHSHVIIVEDDMLFSPDFLSYFQATAPLLDQDPSLWCISTWNDNGLKYFDWDDRKLVMHTLILMIRMQLLAWKIRGFDACAQLPSHASRVSGRVHEILYSPR